MNQGLFSISFTVPGTLGADHTFSFRVAHDCTLIHATASNTSANAGTFKFGTSLDDDYFLTAASFGVSGAASEVEGASAFAGVGAAYQYPRLTRDISYMLTITDHASHMANACVVLTFLAG